VHVSIVAQTRPDAIVIPVESLLTATDNTTSVMVVGRDGRVHRQIVEVGIREDSKVQITKGLSPGEQIVTAGAYGLPDGTRIQVENSSSTTHDK
jgi:multidrug efflux pump subunit AcrA (membrane-fusion protein)